MRSSRLLKTFSTIHFTTAIGYAVRGRAIESMLPSRKDERTAWFRVLGINGTENRVKVPRVCRSSDRPASGYILQSVNRVAKGSKLSPHYGIRNREGIASKQIDMLENQR